MRSCWSACVLFCVAILSCVALASDSDGAILSITKFDAPAYDRLRGIRRYATEAEYKQATSDKRFTVSKVTYTSDGLAVVGYLYGPADGSGAKLPVIVFNRGSYIVNGEIGLYLASFWRLANDGFLIFAPMYRGSEGSPGHDEMGGADVHDVLNALTALKSIKNADPSNMFLLGESRGGMMVLAALREGANVRAAATVGTITDLESFFVEQPKTESHMSLAIWPNYKQDRATILEHRSAVRWAERINVPVLLMHGGQDDSVNPMQSLRMGEALQQHKKEYGLLIFAGDNHVLSAHREERDAQTSKWFRAHMSGSTPAAK